MTTIYADFNNADSEGRVRLNGLGTLRDLSWLGVYLKEDMPLTIHDEELCADGIAHHTSEGVWAARIDWKAIKPWNEAASGSTSVI
jgi:hypothetical protein